MLTIEKVENGIVLRTDDSAVFVSEQILREIVNVTKIAPVHPGETFLFDYLTVESTTVGVIISDGTEYVSVSPNDMYRIINAYDRLVRGYDI